MCNPTDRVHVNSFSLAATVKLRGLDYVGKDDSFLFIYFFYRVPFLFFVPIYSG